MEVSQDTSDRSHFNLCVCVCLTEAPLEDKSLLYQNLSPPWGWDFVFLAVESQCIIQMALPPSETGRYMHLEAVITYCLAFIAVLFCLDQAIAARSLAGGRGGTVLVDLSQSERLEGPERG